MALTQVSRGLLSTSIVDNGNATAITIDSSENVGIGTAPARTFHSKGASGISTAGKFEAGGSQVYVQLASTGQADGDSGYIGYDSSKNLTLFTDNTERMRIDSSGNVGIGVVPEAWHSAFTEVLQVGVASLITSGGDNARVFSNAYYDGAYKRIGTGYAHSYEQTGGTHRWFNAASGSADSSISWAESMRIDESSNLLVGKTTLEYSSNAGVILRNDGLLSAVRDGGNVCNFNRLSSDGEVVQINKDGSTKGAIGIASNSTYIGGSGNGAIYFNDQVDVRPWNKTTQANLDNVMDIGSANSRWDDVFSTGGINTSDRNEKQDIEELTDAEKRVAVACKGLIRKFRWKSSVTKKGDDARIHVGIISQDLRDAFIAEGLDPARYSMWCSDTWTDETSGEEVTRMSVRYNELLAFIISAI